MYNEDLLRCAHIIGSSFRDMHDLVLSVQEFVHFNSVHGRDPDNEYHFRHDLNVKKLLLAALSSDKQKPLLTCGPRARLMYDILRMYNITSKLLQVYTSDYEIVKGHQIIEVWNDHESKWESWDPDFNVYYLDKKTGRHIAYDDLVFGDLEDVLPFNRNSKGWSDTGTTVLKEHYFQAIMYDFPDFHMDHSILVNKDRLNLSKRFKYGTKYMTFREWAHDSYGFPKIVSF